MLPPAGSYEEVYSAFRWAVPHAYNIGVDICDRHADADNRRALIFVAADGRAREYGFRDLQRLSNRLANALAALGVSRGERIAILLPQLPETAVAHIAVYKMGCIAVPLFTLFGEDALRYRLADSGARAVITDPDNLEKVRAVRDTTPDLVYLIVTGDKAPAGAHAFDALTERAADEFTAAATAADDPALIIYTSGTTGPPKGALHAHRVLLGHLPGVEFPHAFFPQAGDLFWTPADWAWIGGLIDVLLPSLHHGVPVLAHRARKFDPHEAFNLIAGHGVRNLFMPPTALKLMRQAGTPAGVTARPRTVASGGETLGAELLDWGRETFGLTINEFYGQTECNLVVGNCAGILPVRPGSMGRAIPGHRIGIVDERGRELGPGGSGQIAIRAPDPVMFLEYWNKPEATRAKFVGEWLLTGDVGRQDGDGYVWFVGREDDIITSASYRIGPAEVEDCLMRHPAVALAAVIGVPDPVRTETVKAFVVLRPGHDPSEATAAEIQAHVRQRLAAHAYPRAVAFVDSLPMTATGKIMRLELRRRETERTGTP